jgi:3-hydroxyacyl-CoA dehydrogenase
MLQRVDGGRYRSATDWTRRDRGANPAALVAPGFANSPAIARARSGEESAMQPIENVVVLGANGTMGSGAAALFAANGYSVSMLARGIDKAHQGLARAKDAVRSDVLGKRIHCGSYEQDLEREVAKADLIFEAVSEDMAIKGPFLERVDKARRKGSVVATVSSGLSIAKMIEARSDDFRKNFVGMHLFNPPHVIVGTELIAGPETDKELFKGLLVMLRKRLGRVVIECADQPAFAGNRVGFKVLNECAQLAEQYGVDKIDYLVGRYTGRAMAPLATIDLVGWDVHHAIVENVFDNTKDEAHAAFAMPKYMAALMDEGHLGNKTPREGGFYRRMTDANGVKFASVLDAKTRNYSEGPTAKMKVGWVEEIKQMHGVGRYADAMAKFLAAEGPEADLARKVILGYVSYALHRVGPGEVVPTTAGVDLIMGYGFNWAPPAALVDLWGKAKTIAALDKAGLPVPPVLAAMKDGERLSTIPKATIGRFFYGK